LLCDLLQRMSQTCRLVIKITVKRTTTRYYLRFTHFLYLSKSVDHFCKQVTVWVSVRSSETLHHWRSQWWAPAPDCSLPVLMIETETQVRWPTATNQYPSVWTVCLFNHCWSHLRQKYYSTTGGAYLSLFSSGFIWCQILKRVNHRSLSSDLHSHRLVIFSASIICLSHSYRLVGYWGNLLNF